MAFKIQLLSDVAGFLKGTKSVEGALEDVGGSLDDLAKETAQNAEEAGDKLEQEFTRAFDKVKTEAKQTGRKVGDDLDDGAKRAGDGIEGLKEEAGQSAREMAASFDGSAESFADMAQEIAAQAGVAFGPWGAAAGLAAGIGIGALKGMLDDLGEKAREAKEEAVDLAQELREVDGNSAMLDMVDRLATKLAEIVDSPFWVAPVTLAEQLHTAIGDLNNAVDDLDIGRAMAGDAAATERVMAGLNAQLEAVGTSFEELDAYRGRGILGDDDEFTRAANGALLLRDAIVEQNAALADGERLYRINEGFLEGTTRDREEAARAAEQQADAERQLAQAQQEAQRASEQWSDALTDHLTVAEEGLDRFVKHGKLNLESWTKELKDRAKEVKAIEKFSVDIEPKLSDAALANFEKLSTETQAQIAKAYKSGGKKDKRIILENLELEAKDAKVTATVETEVDTAQVSSEVKKAADAAQAEANKQSNEIEFSAKIDARDLQRQVDRAAATIRPPVIYAEVKTKKEVP